MSLYSAGTALCLGRPSRPTLSEPPAGVGRPYLKHLCFRRRKKKAVKAISCWPAVPRSSRECENMILFWGTILRSTSVSVVLLLLEMPIIPRSTLLQRFTKWDLLFSWFSFPSYSLSSLYGPQPNLSRNLFQLQQRPRCDLNPRLLEKRCAWWQHLQRVGALLEGHPGSTITLWLSERPVSSHTLKGR